MRSEHPADRLAQSHTGPGWTMRSPLPLDLRSGARRPRRVTAGEHECKADTELNSGGRIAGAVGGLQTPFETPHGSVELSHPELKRALLLLHLGKQCGVGELLSFGEAI